jgi:broad specificity phosphatase PhoE
MNIYLVRHVESELNKVSVHQTEDTPLSPEGLKQAYTVANRLKNSKSTVYTLLPIDEQSRLQRLSQKSLKNQLNTGTSCMK